MTNHWITIAYMGVYCIILVMTPVPSTTQPPAPEKGYRPMENPGMAAIGGYQFPGSHPAKEATNQQGSGYQKLRDLA